MLQSRLLLVLLLCLGSGFAAASAPGERVLQAEIAGQWYPADGKELAALIDDYLARATPKAHPPSNTLRALVVPHAAYRYSGLVAAAGFKLVEGADYKRAVVIGPAHRGGFHGLSIPDADAYQTPLGAIPLDREAIDALRDKPLVHTDSELRRTEHSVAIQLPFLQRTLAPGWRLLPVLVGAMDSGDYKRAAKVLAPLLGPGTLLVVSGDFTHYGPNYGYVPFPPDNQVQDKLRELDMGAFERLAAHDPEGLARYRQETGITACAFGPLMVLLHLMPEAATVDLLDYATSTRVTDDKRHSVSYLAIAVSDPSAFFPGHGQPAAAADEDRPLSREALQILHSLADNAITAALLGSGTPPPVPPADLPPRLREPGAAFVTLKRGNRLRGCIGTARAVLPLFQTVMQSAVRAALGDPRFPPVTPAELPGLQVIVSALQPPRPVASREDIRLQQHGILLSKGDKSALFLPTVAAEQGWDLEQTLDHLAQKAGLEKGGWQEGTQLEVFTTQEVAAPWGTGSGYQLRSLRRSRRQGFPFCPIGLFSRR